MPPLTDGPSTTSNRSSARARSGLGPRAVPGRHRAPRSASRSCRSDPRWSRRPARPRSQRDGRVGVAGLACRLHVATGRHRRLVEREGYAPRRVGRRSSRRRGRRRGRRGRGDRRGGRGRSHGGGGRLRGRRGGLGRGGRRLRGRRRGFGRRGRGQRRGGRRGRRGRDGGGRRRGGRRCRRREHGEVSVSDVDLESVERDADRIDVVRARRRVQRHLHARLFASGPACCRRDPRGHPGRT